MAVQVWIGEKPEHPNERRTIVALANGLERLEGLYLLLTNFNVGGRTIDLAIIKRDAIFLIELKHCDGKVIGGVNGPWFLEDSNGEHKRLNPGRSNPYNQVISYYYSFTNFLNEHRAEILSEHKARGANFRSCRRLVVVAPTIQDGSQLDLDWKVEARGLDELPSYLVTESSPELAFSDEEMLAIPAMLGCTRWNDINALMEGVLPTWKGDTSPATPPRAVAPPPPPAPLPTRIRESLHSFTGRLALAMTMLALALLVAIIVRPTQSLAPSQTQQPLIAETSIPISSPAGGVLAGGIPQETDTCVWSGFQPVGKQWDKSSQTWISVGVDGTAPILLPDVVVTLEQVDYCTEQITLTWSVRNNNTEPVVFPLHSNNITIRDPFGNDYPLDNIQSEPRILRVAPGTSEHGTVVVAEPIVPNAPSLLIRLKEKPFGEASWLVSLEGH